MARARHWYGQSYRTGAWLALAGLGFNLGVLALMQVETVTAGLIAAVVALGSVAAVVTIGAAVHAFITIRRRSDFVRPRWFRSAWLAVSLAVAEIAGLSAIPLAWRAFDIPSGSMMPTLRVGDTFIAETRAYRSRSPERGEVVVFLNAGSGPCPMSSA